MVKNFFLTREIFAFFRDTDLCEILKRKQHFSLINAKLSHILFCFPRISASFRKIQFWEILQKVCESFLSLETLVLKSY